jgi:predicted AlkP superfamily pyrophosphatase or phosphodiesterase
MKLLVIQVAALSFDLFKKHSKAEFWSELDLKSVESIFPAVTSSVQATFRTASLPTQHGMLSNGLWDREYSKVRFWEQSSNLYLGTRIWDEFRKNGNKVAQVCWQQSMGLDSDIVLSPAPIHKHHGGMIQDFYSKPSNLYNDICSKLGRKFNLMNYWGPFTSLKSSSWIVDATIEILKGELVEPNLILTYIPHLDYDLQRYGASFNNARKVFGELEKLLEKLLHHAKEQGYEVILFGDYAINDVNKSIRPNKLLLAEKLFSIRDVKGMYYPNFTDSKCFAVCDHQVAHIYFNDLSIYNRAKELFLNFDGLTVREENSAKYGQYLILEADKGTWFSYKWWDNDKNAPDFATHVDIHNKPGFDPCELFMKWLPPLSVPLDDSIVKGSHGRVKGKENQILISSTISLPNNITDILTLSEFIKSTLS